MPVLYLASKSPRRREILAGMGLSDIEVIHAGPSVLTAFEGDETQHDGEAPQDYVVRTACEKARQAMDRIAAEGKTSSPVLSLTQRLMSRMAIGLSTSLRRQAASQGRTHTRPHVATSG